MRETGPDIRVCIDPLDHLGLFADHGGELPETIVSVSGGTLELLLLPRASGAYMDPSSLMVVSIASMACPRCWMYVFWPSSISWSCNCWSPIGLSEIRSAAGDGVPRLGVP